jgi:hypothetical protein
VGTSAAARARCIGVCSPSLGRITINPSAVSTPLSRTWQRRKIVNWRDYDAGLRRRGSLTVWFTAEAIAGWRAPPRTTAGGQALTNPLIFVEAVISAMRVVRVGAAVTNGWEPADGKGGTDAWAV